MTPLEVVGASCGASGHGFRQREDSEHEQALIRIVVICAMYAFMLLIPHDPARRDWIVQGSTLIFVAGMTGSIAIFAHILWQPAVNRARRFAALLIDCAGANSALLIGGMAASAFYPFLLGRSWGTAFATGGRICGPRSRSRCRCSRWS